METKIRLDETGRVQKAHFDERSVALMLRMCAPVINAMCGQTCPPST